MPAPKIIVFDVNETLLGLSPLRQAVGKALDGREDLLPLWFTTMLHYSLVETLTGQYRDFGEIGVAALLMVAEKEGIELAEDEAERLIVGTITALPAHADVKPGLASLGDQGFTLVSLTNSTNAGFGKQFEYAGLTNCFAQRFSIEDVKRYKPAPQPYQMVLDTVGVAAAEALMVAAHPWDLMGASAVGLQTALLMRPGVVMYPKMSEPDFIADDVLDLANQLQALKR
ncbi:MAG: haloacid dehalogenase type II [Wenzhouxiangellaceae bacterium]